MRSDRIMLLIHVCYLAAMDAEALPHSVVLHTLLLDGFRADIEFGSGETVVVKSEREELVGRKGCNLHSLLMSISPAYGDWYLQRVATMLALERDRRDRESPELEEPRHAIEDRYGDDAPLAARLGASGSYSR